MKYDEWSKGEGIDTRQTNEDSAYNNDGKDAVADALVFNEQRKMREIRREYPKIETYRIPWYYHACKHMYIKNFSLKQVFDINEWVQNKVFWGKDIDDELVAAVG
jgi:hypothetical protein